MSRFFSGRYGGLSPYTPGEQPRGQKFIKLNTNESPYPPSKKVLEAISKEAPLLPLYPDPENLAPRKALAELFSTSAENIFVSNGSDEALYLAFAAFCDQNRPAVFPDITYGFYSVFASVLGLPYEMIPLLDDFSVDINAFSGASGTVFLANPNAPTGLLLSTDDIERIVSSRRECVTVIDEAYIDFGGESAVALTKKYDNLLVIGTFSKSRSLAGGRFGYAVANAEIIADLRTLKYSINPYNVNRLTSAAAVAAISDEEYTRRNCEEIIKTREQIAKTLSSLGFTLTDSRANFLFARHPNIGGERLYSRLRERGILVRHFPKPKISDHLRITVGTPEQMQTLCAAIKNILEDEI